MKLIDYINQQYSGNKSAFASDIGSSFTQVARFIDAGCIWQNGRVYWPKTEKQGS